MAETPEQAKRISWKIANEVWQRLMRDKIIPRIIADEVEKIIGENAALKEDNVELKEVNEYLRDKVKKLKGILKIFDDGSIGDDLDTMRMICVDANHAYEQSSILVEKIERLYEQIAKLKAESVPTNQEADRDDS